MPRGDLLFSKRLSARGRRHEGPDQGGGECSGSLRLAWAARCNGRRAGTRGGTNTRDPALGPTSRMLGAPRSLRVGRSPDSPPRSFPVRMPVRVRFGGVPPGPCDRSCSVLTESLAPMQQGTYEMKFAARGWVPTRHPRAPVAAPSVHPITLMPGPPAPARKIRELRRKPGSERPERPRRGSGRGSTRPPSRPPASGLLTPEFGLASCCFWST